jgi:hypothetical protein
MSESSTEHADAAWPHPESDQARTAGHWRPSAALPDGRGVRADDLAGAVWLPAGGGRVAAVVGGAKARGGAACRRAGDRPGRVADAGTRC